MCFGALRSPLFCSASRLARFGLLRSLQVCSCATCLILSQSEPALERDVANTAPSHHSFPHMLENLGYAYLLLGEVDRAFDHRLRSRGGIPNQSLTTRTSMCRMAASQEPEVIVLGSGA
jgi:hypothetical protein